MKQPKCSFCGETGHYQTFCRSKPKKPIGTITDVTKQWKARKKAISPVSDKRKKQLAEYRVVRDKYMAEHPICQFPNCISRDIQLHHGKGRCGSLLSDVRYFKSLCDTHHRFVELNPEIAQKMGLSFKRLE